jgi:hypothetical protein
MPANLKRNSYPACGRLIILQSVGNRPLNDENWTENYQGMASINFPAMPETIELVRKTDYMVSSNFAFPDGIHQYKATQPLTIPIKFKLHAFDREYCPKGVLSLLQVAAEMHALTLPISPEDVKITVGEAAPDGVAPSGKTNTEVAKSADGPSSLAGQLDQQTYNIFPPPTCYLELIITDRESPGIACIGYVSEASVTLHGPWMKGSGIAQNLPTMGEFSFTFVHHPGHGNAYNYGQKNFYNQGQSEKQAYARTVRNRLYNTHHLLTNANFRGIDDT